MEGETVRGAEPAGKEVDEESDFMFVVNPAVEGENQAPWPKQKRFKKAREANVEQTSPTARWIGALPFQGSLPVAYRVHMDLASLVRGSSANAVS